MIYIKENITRRRFLKRCGGAALLPFCINAVPGYYKGKREKSTLETRLIGIYKDAQLCDISYDGIKLCLEYFVDVRRVSKQLHDAAAKQKGHVLRVVDLETRRGIFSTQLRTMVARARFFADGKRLYAETMPAKEDNWAHQLIIYNVETMISEQLKIVDGYDISYYPLEYPYILGLKSKLDGGQYRFNEIVLATLPDYTEMMQVPHAAVMEPEHYGRPRYGVDSKPFYGNDTPLTVSADRKTIVYGAGHHVVCRRTSDLQVVWTRQIGPEYFGCWLLDITPNGGMVAAAIVGGSSSEDHDKHCIMIYDGKDGSIVSKLVVDGSLGVAISPKGELLAVSQPVLLSSELVQPSVSIYDISSSELVAKVMHPTVNVSRFPRAIKAEITPTFTADGRYLITVSSYDSRIWAIRRNISNG